MHVFLDINNIIWNDAADKQIVWLSSLGCPFECWLDRESIAEGDGYKYFSVRRRLCVPYVQTSLVQLMHFTIKFKNRERMYAR